MSDLTPEDRRLLFSKSENAIGDLAALLFGMGIALGVVSAAFFAVRWLAGALDWRLAPDTAGLLGAIAAVWLFLHKHLDAKLDRMRSEQDASMQAIWERLSGQR